MKLSTLFISFLIYLTACQKSSSLPEPISIKISNPGFEDSLKGWTVETGYLGIYGFQASPDAKRTGKYGLNFYAAQSSHFPGAPQETPWNGKIYQIITGLKNGNYTFKVYADAAGTGMYLFANSNKQKIKSNIKGELNTLDFIVTGGTATIGFICIDADGNGETFSPYFHADDVELLKQF